MSSRNNSARIAIVMGSKSDWATMQFTAEILDALNVPYHVEVVSAHRTPDKLFSFAESAESHGYQVIIAGAGGAAHLPGMIAAKTLVPVLGVPVQSAALSGVDSLYSIVQMPRGIPVGTPGHRQSWRCERRPARRADPCPARCWNCTSA
ncbi:phosphoribosylaminoimidazole carboxylase catalytic subunit [Klebsiella pneumoniae]|uniref:N5-carboxyaminoimidazole ribonucleotide mutase n=1 Tax=Klebsiella pneumoniae TaxID=573 RepID=A0A2X1QKT9_KLEPN|nr:phosphoribosylaminoimidazole carboxylase catalytic subunit [Klebsiella pneumoniae]